MDKSRELIKAAREITSGNQIVKRYLGDGWILIGYRVGDYLVDLDQLDVELSEFEDVEKDAFDELEKAGIEVVRVLYRRLKCTNDGLLFKTECTIQMFDGIEDAFDELGWDIG